MSLAHLKVGDPIVVIRPYYRNESQRTHVSKVGRKYLYVDGDRDGYDRETGRCKTNGGGYGYHVMTIEAHDRSARIDAACRELRSLNIEPSRLPRDKVEAVLAAVRPILAPLNESNAGGNDGQ